MYHAYHTDLTNLSGAYDGTWNPGLLLARASAGGAAFVLSLLDALEEPSLRRGPELEVSDQSLMCAMLLRALQCDRGVAPTRFEHARLATDGGLHAACALHAACLRPVNRT